MADLKTEHPSRSLWPPSPDPPSRHCGRYPPVSVTNFSPPLQSSFSCTVSQARLDLLPTELIQLIILHLLEFLTDDPVDTYRPVYCWKPIVDPNTVNPLSVVCKTLRESVMGVVLCNVALRSLEPEQKLPFIRIKRKMGPADFAPFSNRPGQAETSFLGSPATLQSGRSQF